MGENRILSKEDTVKYAGQYVVTKSFQDHTVVAADKDPVKAIKKAKEKGVTDGVIFYVLHPNKTFIYNLQKVA